MKHWWVEERFFEGNTYTWTRTLQIHPFSPSPGMTAAAFFTGAQDSSKGGRNKGSYSKGTVQAVKRSMCAYCKGSHTANNCDAVKDCCKIVKKEKFCFNCLAHHRVSECDSKQSSKLCGHRHHTSLCRNNVSSGSNDTSSVQVEGKKLGHHSKPFIWD